MSISLQFSIQLETNGANIVVNIDKNLKKRRFKNVNIFMMRLKY